MSRMVWQAQRARNLGLISDYASDYFSESSAESDHSHLESEEEEGERGSERVSRSKVRAPPRYPRPHSHLLRNRDGQRARGNKHARRWANSMFISSLYQLPEEELERGFSILPDHSSPFTLLHTDQDSMQVWNAFASCPEEEQMVMLRGPQRGAKNHPRGGEGVWGTADQRFKSIDRHIRMMLRHNKHLPHVFLEEMEAELTQYFIIDRSAVVVSIHSDTYYRLLVHGLCQYMGLTSTTLHKDGVSLMLLECSRDSFTPPPISLSTHLTSHHLTSPAP